MARLTAETIERVKDAADFVEIASPYTELRRAGARYSGLCPFHDERTPSFSIDPAQKLYYCFGCEAKGDIFTFLEEKEGMEFAEAVESLAERYGIELEREREDPEAERARKRRARLGELCDRTAAFYAAYLWDSDEAQRARRYLTERGLGEEVLRDLGVGYAPSAWDTVIKRGQRAGYSVDELLTAGLAQRGRKGAAYDRFRARITFPIRDPRGRVLGFGARALRPDTKPKYLNSPEGELYRKSHTLFGIDRARPAMAQTRRAVVVEGYTDVLAAHQAGVREAVAVMGTAVTPEQLGQLSGHVAEIVLALDADRAGRAAMLRAQRVAQGKRLRLRVARMPEGRDPADLLAGAGPDDPAARRFAEALDAAIGIAEFHVRTILQEADLSTPLGRDAALDEAAPVLAAMGETISRDELVAEVADRLDAAPGLVARRVRSGPSAGERADGGGEAGKEAGGSAEGSSRSPGASEARRARGPRERRAIELLGMCVGSPDRGREYLERLRPEHVGGQGALWRAREWLLEHLEAPAEGLPRSDEELVSVVIEATMQADRWQPEPESMEWNLLELERRALEDEIASSRGAGGDPPVELQRRRAEVTQRLAHMHRSR